MNARHAGGLIAVSAALAACAAHERFHAVDFYLHNHWEPDNQRPAADTCPVRPEPERAFTRGPRVECASSADCTARPRGFCNAFILKATPFATCKYDECRSDADCEAGRVCRCDFTNRCVPAACRTNADCGEGRWCSYNEASARGAAGYHCHSREDGCVRDAPDCPSGEACAYDEAARRWACIRDKERVPQ